jgi:hypothetical protein
MYLNVEVIREADNKLFRESWRLTQIDNYLSLAQYLIERRNTLRHKYQIEKSYNFTDHRNNTISLIEVPFPDDVKQEAIDLLVKQIKVVKEINRG